jgi:hypothetical protein
MNRPTYEVPANTSAPMAAMLKAAADRKAVWIDPAGEAFWLNDLAQAEAIAAKNGGLVFPPIA